MQNAIEAGTRWADAAPGVASKSYLALLHIDGGDVKTALRLGEEVLAEDRENIDANVAVGSASMESQETRRARECFEAALRHDPENGRAWLGMGLVHMYDQEPQKAIAALANAARIFPDSAGIAVTYGWSFVIALDAAGAEQAFLKALTVDRTFSEAHAGLAAALALQGKVDGAHASLELARRLNRHSIAADVADSFLKAARGQQQEAIDAFAAMLKKSPREDILPLLDQLRIYTKKKPLTAAKKTH
jgi:tetratricopeptide (TPR) repeat protein